MREKANRCQPQVGFWVTIGSTAAVREEEEEDHQMSLKTDSSQESPLVFQNDRKNPDEECRGKSFGGLAGGVGESVYGVQQCVSGR